MDINQIKDELRTLLDLNISTVVSGTSEVQTVSFCSEKGSLRVKFTNNLWEVSYQILHRDHVFNHPGIDRIIRRAFNKLHLERVS